MNHKNISLVLHSDFVEEIVKEHFKINYYPFKEAEICCAWVPDDKFGFAGMEITISELKK